MNATFPMGQPHSHRSAGRSRGRIAGRLRVPRNTRRGRGGGAPPSLRSAAVGRADPHVDAAIRTVTLEIVRPRGARMYLPGSWHVRITGTASLGLDSARVPAGPVVYVSVQPAGRSAFGGPRENAAGACQSCSSPLPRWGGSGVDRGLLDSSEENASRRAPEAGERRPAGK